MLRISLFLMLGILSSPAQTSIEDSNKVNPNNKAAINPATPPAAAGIAPDQEKQPPDAGPNHLSMPAAPKAFPKLDKFTVSPATVREGYNYKESLKTTVTLSSPATKDTLCHVVSADPQKVVCGDILVPKGAQQTDGVIQVNWKKVHHNCQVAIKAFEDENPEAIFRARIYLRKKAE